MSITTEPETMGELIADCADIPPSLHTEVPRARPGAARTWAVDDDCHAQVAELDLYI
ncbi:hypothetical protein [Amycolatopsis sp.]|uniref:hypothetical protein n=1 Tax=Amycolatopsis sp. TaxID=37632 RepID=UPI002611CAA3|nr:hypothetical protein [Amycolatopsis sp.]